MIKRTPLHEIGTPYYLYDKIPGQHHSRNRVVPSPFSYLTLPLSCSFIRNLGMEEEEQDW